MNGRAPDLKGLALWQEIGNRACDESPWSCLWAKKGHQNGFGTVNPPCAETWLSLRFHTDVYFSPYTLSGWKFCIGRVTLKVDHFKEDDDFNSLRKGSQVSSVSITCTFSLQDLEHLWTTEFHFFICFDYKGSVLLLKKWRRKQGIRGCSEQASELGSERAEDEEEGIWKPLERRKSRE